MRGRQPSESAVQQRITEPANWYARVPQYLRSATTASEKAQFLQAICDVAARIGAEAPVRRPNPSDGLAQVIEPGREAGRPTVSAGAYEIADPATVARPNRERFYDVDYLPTLSTMVAHVLAVEAPIYEDLLVDRVARAHGQQRAGWQIRRCVLAALPAAAVSLDEGDGRKVVWAEAACAAAVVPFRSAAGGARNHSDVPIHELASIAVLLMRLKMDDESILRRMADAVNVGRLREPTRLRMQAALAIAREIAR